MRLNLCSVRVPCDAQALHEPLRYLHPVLLRVGYLMRIQITHCSIEFSFWYNPFDLFDLKFKSVSEVSDLFTDGRGCGALAMCAAHHGYMCILLSQTLQLSEYASECDMHDVSAGVMEHQSICEVVDILTSA